MLNHTGRLSFLVITCLFATISSYATGIITLHKTCYLHQLGLYVCCSITGIIFAILLYSLVKYRQARGKQATHFHTHMGLEIFWTIVPFLILIGLAMPAINVLRQICE